MTYPSRTWHRTALIFWWAVLLGSVALSSFGNVTHARNVAPERFQSWASLIGGAFPWALLVMVEGIALGTRGGASGRARTVALGVIVPLAVIVFASSYMGLLFVVQATGLFNASGSSVPFLNFGVAAVPDLLMVASTVYIFSMRSSLTVAKAVRGGSRWSRIGDNLLARAERLTEVTEPQAVPVVEVRGDSAESVAAPLVEPAKPSVNLSAEPTVKVRKPAPKPSVDAALEPFMDTAQRLVDGGVVARKTAVELARVIAAVEEGKSDNAIKNSGLASASTASKVRMALASPEDVRVLTAV
ncbi:hypothetical protein [Mycobacteroides abscessus]|uniref:hypothetical protein n=1 Tax=Mycobacteroides abscessus TaxID=36809 RepID=UPI0009A5926B|nr:hypothetical protein [Mycobacteroides abscessus]MBN7314128.1 hypothetical protein [Mycobacteroides abscessus subsp. abscessus]